MSSPSHSSNSLDVKIPIPEIPDNNPLYVSAFRQKEENKEEKKEDPTTLNPNHSVTYKQIVTILKDSYNFDENVTSTSLDILTLYLKGQKFIYTESKTYCEKRLNSLMMPAIFIAAVCSILNFILKDYSYGTIIISCLNALNSFLLSIINYLKLAEKSQNHLTAAQRFHKLEARTELKSGRSLFFNESVNIQDALEDIEKQVKEIQSSDQFIVPEAIRHRYPQIYSTNVFSLVKEIKNDEMLIINELKNAVQQIHFYIEHKQQLLARQKDLRERVRKCKEQKNALELEKELLELSLDDDPFFTYFEKEKKGKEDREEEEEEEEERDDEKGEKEKDSQFLKKSKKLDKLDKSKLSKLLDSKIRIKHISLDLDRYIIQLNEIKQDLEDVEEIIKKYDEEKNNAFNKSVKHRQKYIDLSDKFHREINKHIDISNKNCWSPCDFFNT